MDQADPTEKKWTGSGSLSRESTNLGVSSCNPGSPTQPWGENHHKMDLRSVARKRKVYKRLEEIAHYHHYPNLLQRNFSANPPNQKWVTEPVSSFIFRSKFV